MKDNISQLDDTLSRLGRHFAAMKPRHHCGHMSDAHMVLLRRLDSCDGLRMNEIAQLLAVKPPAVSAIIDHLEDVKVVERVPDPTDRRATLIRLTEKGHKTFKETNKERVDTISSHLSVLNAQDRNDFLRICNKLLDSFEHPTHVSENSAQLSEHPAQSEEHLHE